MSYQTIWYLWNIKYNGASYVFSNCYSSMMVYVINHFESVCYKSKYINICDILVLRFYCIISTHISITLCRKESNKKCSFELRPYYVLMADMLQANTSEATNWFKIFDPPSKKPQTSNNIFIIFVIQYIAHGVKIVCF